jgi:flagellar export protein FliJ
MSFRFPLAAVLKFRENMEQREYLTLEKIHQEIAAVEAQLQQIEEWRLAAIQQRETDLGVGIASIHLQADFEQELALEQRRDALQVKLQDLKLKRRHHLKAYQVARQKREVLDELRTRQFNTYTKDQAKRQQAMVDDLFLSRRRRNN